MALFENTIFSSLRGSIDMVTFYRRNGKTYVRRKIMRRKAPTTSAQTRNETKFGRFQKTVKAFKDIIHLGFSYKDGSKRKGRFISLNLQTLKQEETLEYLDCSSLRLSEGSLEKLSLVRVNSKGRTIHLSWEVEEDVATGQKTIICIFNQAQHKVIYAEAQTASGKAECILPEDWKKETCHVYLFSMIDDKRSDSQYLGLAPSPYHDSIQIVFRQNTYIQHPIQKIGSFSIITNESPTEPYTFHKKIILLFIFMIFNLTYFYSVLPYSL